MKIFLLILVLSILGASIARYFDFKEIKPVLLRGVTELEEDDYEDSTVCFNTIDNEEICVNLCVWREDCIVDREEPMMMKPNEQKIISGVQITSRDFSLIFELGKNRMEFTKPGKYYLRILEGNRWEKGKSYPLWEIPVKYKSYRTPTPAFRYVL